MTKAAGGIAYSMDDAGASVGMPFIAIGENGFDSVTMLLKPWSGDPDVMHSPKSAMAVFCGSPALTFRAGDIIGLRARTFDDFDVIGARSAITISGLDASMVLLTLTVLACKIGVANPREVRKYLAQEGGVDAVKAFDHQISTATIVESDKEN